MKKRKKGWISSKRHRFGQFSPGQVKSIKVRSGQVISVMSGQATSNRSGEFRFVQIVREVPGR